MASQQPTSYALFSCGYCVYETRTVRFEKDWKLGNTTAAATYTESFPIDMCMERAVGFCLDRKIFVCEAHKQGQTLPLQEYESLQLLMRSKE